MKAHALISTALVIPVLALSSASAEEADQKAAASQPMLPAGMAPADDPKAVAALHSEANQKRVEAIEKKAPQQKRLTAAEEYHLKLIAYREQLVEQQRQRQIQELELQLEREARLLAEERAAEAERQRRRETILLQHHTLHAYQRNLNDEFWREQRLLRALERKQCQQPQPPCPQPAPAPSPAPASTEDDATSGDVLP